MIDFIVISLFLSEAGLLIDLELFFVGLEGHCCLALSLALQIKVFNTSLFLQSQHVFIAVLFLLLWAALETAHIRLHRTIIYIFSFAKVHFQFLILHALTHYLLEHDLFLGWTTTHIGNARNLGFLIPCCFFGYFLFEQLIFQALFWRGGDVTLQTIRSTKLLLVCLDTSEIHLSAVAQIVEFRDFIKVARLLSTKLQTRWLVVLFVNRWSCRLLTLRRRSIADAQLLLHFFLQLHELLSIRLVFHDDVDVLDFLYVILY